ncbi:hypothetical protein ACROYT_G019154 [Oculina patagonica]
MKRARGQAAKILFVLWNDSAFCSSLFAMNEIESFLLSFGSRFTPDHERCYCRLSLFQRLEQLIYLADTFGSQELQRQFCLFQSLEQIGYLADKKS